MAVANWTPEVEETVWSDLSNGVRREDLYHLAERQMYRMVRRDGFERKVTDLVILFDRANRLVRAPRAQAIKREMVVMNAWALFVCVYVFYYWPESKIAEHRSKFFLFWSLIILTPWGKFRVVTNQNTRPHDE